MLSRAAEAANQIARRVFVPEYPGFLELFPPSAVEMGRECRPWPARMREKGAQPMIISILITFLVIILILYLVDLLPIDGRAKQIVRVVIVVIGVLSLLRFLGVSF